MPLFRRWPITQEQWRPGEAGQAGAAGAAGAAGPAGPNGATGASAAGPQTQDDYNNAAIAVLNATPDPLSAALVAGAMLLPIFSFAETNVVTGGTNSPTFQVRWNGDTAVLSSQSSQMATGNRNNGRAGIYVGGSMASLVNTPLIATGKQLTLTTNNAPTGAPDASARYSTLYLAVPMLVS